MRLLYTTFLLFIFTNSAFSQIWYYGRKAVCVGDSLALPVNLLNNYGGNWSSSNTAVIQIGSIDGMVHGVSIGTATISYQYLGTIDTVTFVVGNTYPSRRSVSFAGTGPKICARSKDSRFMLFASDSQVSYSIINGPTNFGSFQGTGGDLDFGELPPMRDTFSVIGTSNISGCTSFIGSSP